MSVTYANPRYATPSDKLIDLDVTTGGGETYPTSVAAPDPLFQQAVAEAFGPVAAYVPPASASTVAALVAYAEAKQAAVMAAGLTANVGTTSAPVEVFASTDPLSLALLLGAASSAAKDSTFQATWVSKLGAVVLTAAEILVLEAAVQAFIQASFTTLSQVLAAIEAVPPTIAATAAIDTPPLPISAWPTNS